MDEKSDLLQVLERCKKGDLNAQKLLYEHLKTKVFNICMRYARDRSEAQDMLQESFLTIFRDLHQYVATGAFEGWAYRVSVRVALQYLRKKNPLRFAEDIDAFVPEQWAVTPDQELGAEALLSLVHQLPTGCRTIFNMHCVEGWSYQEIAVELGLAESSIRSQYTRACNHLRLMVEQQLNTPITKKIAQYG